MDNNQEDNSAEDVGTTLLNLILDAKLEFHIDQTRQPCLILPGEHWPQSCRLQSPRAKAYLAALAWNSAQIVPRTADIDRVIRVLEGIAWNSAPRDAARDILWQSLEDIPLLQAIIEFMREKMAHEATMHTFLSELKQLATSCNLDVYSKRWPKIPAHLSAQLREQHHQAILKRFGITLTFSRNRDGAKVVLKRQPPSTSSDDELQAASPLTSQGNSLGDNDLHNSDAGDGEKQKQKIRERIVARQEQYHLSKQETNT